MSDTVLDTGSTELTKAALTSISRNLGGETDMVVNYYVKMKQRRNTVGQSTLMEQENNITYLIGSGHRKAFGVGEP